MNTNYDIVSNLVHNEVFACISDMAEYLFDWDNEKYASYDEWENLYKSCCPECGSIIDTKDYEEMIECQYCSSRLDSDGLDMYPIEIYEFWLVSPYLGEKLREYGEAILERWGAWVWGRTCTGQSIALDGVIQKIALEGMERSNYNGA